MPAALSSVERLSSSQKLNMNYFNGKEARPLLGGCLVTEGPLLEVPLHNYHKGTLSSKCHELL